MSIEKIDKTSWTHNMYLIVTLRQTCRQTNWIIDAVSKVDITARNNVPSINALIFRISNAAKN